MLRRLLLPIVLLLAAPLAAATPRELMTQAAFQTANKAQALALVNQAYSAATGTGREAQLQRAFALGYRAKLTRSPGDAKATRRLFEGLVAADPRDPEAQLGLGGWHLDAVAEGLLAASVLGAKKATGVAAVDQAVVLGGNRAFFRAFAAMMRIRLDPRDVAAARGLAEAAAGSPAPTALDRIGRRDAEALLVPLRAGDGRAAADLARRMLPFGRLR